MTGAMGGTEDGKGTIYFFETGLLEVRNKFQGFCSFVVGR